MTKIREVRQCGYKTQPVDLPEDFDGLRGWLAGQANAHSLTHMLAHADDGVIWGYMNGDELKLSGDAFPNVSPKLRKETLQQARLFGPGAELLLWRDNAWHARLLTDDTNSEGALYFDEMQWQWGERFEDPKSLPEKDGERNPRDGFLLVNEGAEGLRHAVPLGNITDSFDPATREADRWHPLRLKVRHYLQTDPEIGTLSIIQSRLVELTKEARNGKS